MIPVVKLLAYFKRMYKEHWPYEWGAARTGCVDCSGAFVWAYKQEGEDIYHGSNRIARVYVGKLLPISEAKPGMAAFKARKPGDRKYALPQGYTSGGGQYNGDLLDYYHIGLVDDDPAYVLNAKSTAEGFKRSPITENWHYVAYLNDVEYEKEIDEMKVLYTAEVTANSGSTVNLRDVPDGEVMTRVPIGVAVNVYEENEGWSHIRYGDIIGYMKSDFLKKHNNTSSTFETEVLEKLNEILKRLPA